jgi:hypothetical protein
MLSNKFIHVHVPKTAGQKIRLVLRRNRERFDFLNEESHLSLQEAKTKLEKDYGITDDVFSFTFIRNPWDFYVSRFFYRKGLEEKEDIVLEQFDASVEGFQQHMYMLKNLLSEEDVLNSFHDFVLTQQGNIAITRTYNFVGIEGWHNHMVFPKVDFIGRFENFQNDFFIVLKTIFKDEIVDEELVEHCREKINVSNRLDYREYYNTELIDLVYKWDQNYCNTFGYSFEK